MFKQGSFTSHSGIELSWKIDCDLLSDDSIKALAAKVAEKFAFSHVYGIERGGMRLARALGEYKDSKQRSALIVDDVLTTGKSMIDARQKLLDDVPVYGIVIVSRTNLIPHWIYPILTLNIPFQK